MFEFKVDITVDGVPYNAGQIVPKNEIPAGCLEVLIRQQRVIEKPKPVSQNPPAKKA
jgi:hypothetical protein